MNVKLPETIGELREAGDLNYDLINTGTEVPEVDEPLKAASNLRPFRQSSGQLKTRPLIQRL
jgi:hypothetical protein